MAISTSDVIIDNVPLPIDGNNPNAVNVILPRSSTATVAQIAVTANTNVSVLAANPNRKSAIIFCPSATLYLKFGTTASATSFTYKITASNTTISISGWTGEIDAFGSAQTVTVTELV